MPRTAHESLLLELFTAAWPETRAPRRRGPEWRELGFQGDDPSTDFRATGPLGLRALLHIARTRREFFADAVAAPRAYGFAVLVVNLTHTVAVALDLLPRSAWAAPRVAPEPRNDACAAFRLLFCGSETAFEDVVAACAERCDNVWTSVVATTSASETPPLLTFQTLMHDVLVECQKALVACARFNSMPTTADLRRALVERPSLWRYCRRGVAPARAAPL